MKSIFNKYLFFTAFAALLLFSECVVGQFTIPPKPIKVSEQTSLYDYIGLLTASQKKALEKKLISYADSTSTQIVVAIIGTSNGDDLALVGAKWGQQWGIGQADEDNGILIILAKDDRKVDINTGYGIEYRVSDRTAERIINRVMIPQFKSGNYYAGLDKGSDALFDALMGEFKEDRDFSKKDGNNGNFIFVIVIFIIILILLRRKGGKGGKGGGGSSLLDVIILSNMGRTGGFGGSGGSFGGGGSYGGGGGFGGGFGGGGFGGGGASGGW